MLRPIAIWVLLSNSRQARRGNRGLQQNSVIKPDYAEAYNNMGNALREQGKIDEAIEAYTKALTIKPDYAEAHNNMGNAFQEQGRPEKQ